MSSMSDDFAFKNGTAPGESEPTEAGSPRCFEDLDHTDPDAGERQRWRRLAPRAALVGGIVLVLIAAAVGILAFGPSLKGPLGGDVEPDPSPSQPSATAAAVSPTPPASPVPTVPSTQVVVKGPETYVDPARPYKAAYALTLRAGGRVSVAVECPACLRRPPDVLTLAEGDRGVVEVVVPPGRGEVALSVLVDGALCTDWVLAPGREETTFGAACSP